MSQSGVGKLKIVAVAVVSAAVAACGSSAPPPPPVVYAPPPPPPKIVIPPRPTAPAGAFATMAVPQMAENGVRQTVNYGISDEQKLWNVRSGLNVAALNCRSNEHISLADNYRAFLQKHRRQLSRTNRDLASQYRAEHGRRYRDAQDAYMTRVYNYFALPPALPAFCDVAHEIGQEIVNVPSGQLHIFTESALPRMEAVYEEFFSAYEKYRVDLAAWEAQYGPNRSPVTMEANYGPQPNETAQSN